jgi:hypothetical protein
MVVYGRDYETNDDQESFEPDWNDLSLYDEQVLAFEEKHAHKNYLRRHWAGHLSLPVSYWVNGFLLSIALAAGAEFLADKAGRQWGSLRLLAIFALSFLAVYFLVWIWSSVGIWRSAYWHRRRGGSPGWGIAARALILVSAAATLYRSGDLALQATELGQLAAGRDSLGEIAEMKVSDDGRDLVLRGHIAAGAADRFQSVLDANRGVRAVVLTSPGGRMLESGRIAAMIRERGLDTRVDDFCMSACTDLLLAGRMRTAPNRARIGFHQPDFPGMSAYELRGAVEQTRNRYLEAGVESGFVWRAMATPASGMWFPTNDELFAANVLTGSDIVVTSFGDGKRAAGRAESLSERRLRADLQADAARINASGPRKLDALTTLDRATATNFTLTHFYTVKTDGRSVNRKQPGMAAALRNQVCGDPGASAAVRDGARFEFVYRDKAGKRLFEISVTQC